MSKVTHYRQCVCCGIWWDLTTWTNTQQCVIIVLQDILHAQCNGLPIHASIYCVLSCWNIPNRPVAAASAFCLFELIPAVDGYGPFYNDTLQHFRLPHGMQGRSTERVFNCKAFRQHQLQMMSCHGCVVSVENVLPGRTVWQIIC